MLLRLTTALALVSTLWGCGTSEPRHGVDISTILRDDDSNQFQKVEKPTTFTFPRDHGAHKNFRQEWWYVTSILKTDSGREFGAQFTLFRVGLDADTDTEDWRSNQLYHSHVALSNVEAEEHIDFERTARGHAEMVRVSQHPFELFIDGWRLHSTSDAFSPLRLHVKNRELEMMFTMETTKPVALHGDRGYSQKAPGYASYYYSIPRLATQGFITVAGNTFRVSGNSWLDHEWFTGGLGSDYSGWDWMTLQLDDGSDLVFASLRSKQNNEHTHPFGLSIDATGEVEPLNPVDWSFSPAAYWKEYPVKWDVKVGARRLMVTPAFEDQVMNTSIRYWEGLVHVLEDDRRVGSGYLELTGY